MSFTQFWNMILTINSLILICSTTFLVYSFGMLILRFDWRLFLITLTFWGFNVASELVLSALAHE